MGDFGCVADLDSARRHHDIRRGKSLAAETQSVSDQLVPYRPRTDGDVSVCVLDNEGSAAESDREDIRHAEIGSNAADLDGRAGLTRKALVQ